MTALKDTNCVFATITSDGYIDQTAGLYLNLQEHHPEMTLLVCGLDKIGYETFAQRAAQDGSNIVSVRAQDIWGDEAWLNLQARCNRPERAFATKAALTLWGLEQGAEAVVILDSDLLFMDRIDDILEKAKSHDVMLTAARHHLRHWRKTNTFGLFSAGIVGMSKSGLQAAKIWKAMVFDECRALPVDGLFNEQKYLDYLIGFFNTAIIRDPGINISPTLLKLVEPRCGEDGQWLTKAGVPIRVFHYSRSSRSEFPFVHDKEEFNRRGLEAFGLGKAEQAGQTGQAAKRQSDGPRKPVLYSVIRKLRVGHLIDSLPKYFAALARRVLTLHRVIGGEGGTMRQRYHQAFREKAHIAERMYEDAFETDLGEKRLP